MKDKINTYFAVLIITIFGAGAALIIIRVAYTNHIVAIYGDDTAIYTYL